MSRPVWLAISIIQLGLAARFVRTVLRTLDRDRIPQTNAVENADRISVIVPALNEAGRLEPCLASLAAQSDSIGEILVVDGGSEDGTQQLVQRWESIDPRMRLLRTGPIPPDWNGKAWGLQTGWDSIAAETLWVVTVDADVRCQPDALDRAIAFARSRHVPVLSLASKQHADTRGLAIVHPSLLSTLVYRFGAPGHVARSVSEVQSNGQFAVYRRDALQRAGGFVMARDSICEDVTLARHLHLLGYDVGFFEGEGFVETKMYADGWECLSNWPRSLSLRDRIRPRAGIDGLFNILFLQVLPLLEALRQQRQRRLAGTIPVLDRFLLISRIGVVAGTRRAYSTAHPTYWLSPLFDPIMLLAYCWYLVRRRNVWRGRELVHAE